MRIVSLLPSATEIICALGLEHDLVGRSHECDYPLAVKKLPVLSEPKVNVHAGSGEIDRSVKRLVENGLSIYRIDAEKLKALKPDFVVTQTQCEVCAVSPKDIDEALCSWTAAQPKTISLTANSLKEVWQDFHRVADALGNLSDAAGVVEKLKRRMADISKKATGAKTRPTVAVIEWIEPLMSGGNWMPELVAMAGGINLFGEAGKHSPWLSWEDLAEKNPDAILITPCGFDIAHTRQDLPALTERAEWKKLNAVKNNRVYLADGNQYFNRPGPRLVESLEILVEILHPELLHFGHKGLAWEIV